MEQPPKGSKLTGIGPPPVPGHTASADAAGTPALLCRDTAVKRLLPYYTSLFFQLQRLSSFAANIFSVPMAAAWAFPSIPAVLVVFLPVF
jgi:hypothetical protein